MRLSINSLYLHFPNGNEFKPLQDSVATDVSRITARDFGLGWTLGDTEPNTFHKSSLQDTVKQTKTISWKSRGVLRSPLGFNSCVLSHDLNMRSFESSPNKVYTGNAIQAI